MFEQATRACVAAAIRESEPGGWIRQYYHKQASWEDPMRWRFAELVATRRSTGSFASANERLRDLNRDYRTRFKLDHLPAVAASIERAIDQSRWWCESPPAVLGSSPEDAEAIASLVKRAVSGVTAPDAKRPYSLATKFLHFSFPETITIYDAQVAASIQVWSFFAFAHDEPGWRRFGFWPIAATDAGSYRSVLVYRAFWDAASPEQRDDLRRAAIDVSAVLGGPTTIVDLVDKLMWRANGDPRLLGLLDGLNWD